MLQNRFWLWLSAAFAVVYTGYVVWAKFAKVLGPPPVKLGEVGEFWLFFMVIAAFALQVIVEDRRTRATSAESERP